jgi:hypothetical protein
MSNVHIDAPVDEEPARVPLASHPAPHGVPMVLQISLLQETSDPEEYFYVPFANLKAGDSTAVQTFFIHHGHTIVYHKCPDTAAFQELFPPAPLRYFSPLSEGLIFEGYSFLETQCAAQRTSQEAAAPPQESPPVTPLQSLHDRYVAAGFVGEHGHGGLLPPLCLSQEGLVQYLWLLSPLPLSGPSLLAFLASLSQQIEQFHPRDVGVTRHRGGLILAMVGMGGFLAVPIWTLMWVGQSILGGVVLHSAASVTSSLGDTTTLLHSLPHADARSSSDLDLTLSFDQGPVFVSHIHLLQLSWAQVCLTLTLSSISRCFP